MSKPLHVWFDQSTEDGDLVRRLIFEDVEGPDGPRAESWWRLPGSASRPELPVLDSLVCAHMQWAATLGQDMIVHGPMSAGGLYNMGQLMQHRYALAPSSYRHPVDILPERVVTGGLPQPPPRHTIAAFSGGLDSTFSIVRHAKRLAGDASWPIAGLVLVLGFDVPLNKTDRFAALKKRLTPLAESLGLPLHTIATNSSLLGGRVWPHSAMPLFGGALVHFSDLSTRAMVSSGPAYGVRRFATMAHGNYMDAFSSNDYFTMFTDGCGYTRTEKAEALIPFPEALRSVKVCWQGPDPSANCGDCPKCVLTRMNFLGAGLRHPPCFDQPLTPHHIASLALPSMGAARDFFRDCWLDLERRGITGPEVTLLRQRLSRTPPDCVAPAVDRWAGRVRQWVPSGVRRTIHQTLARWTS